MQYGLGRIPSPIDGRDHSLALQAPEVAATAPLASYAPRYLWTVLNQGQKPACVGYSGALGRQIETMLEESQALDFDPDDLYRLCKQNDGSPNTDGTFIRVACQVLQSEGGLVEAVLYEILNREQVKLRKVLDPQCESELPYVIGTLNSQRPCLGHGNCNEQKRGQNSNDGDDDQKFNQTER